MRYNRIGKLVAVVLVLSMLVCTVPAMAADTVRADSVYRNANVYTMDDKMPTATAIAVKGDKLIYVGNEAGVEAFIGPSTKITDVKGKTLLPGIIEGHMHIGMMGDNLMKLDIFWKPKQVILDLVKEAAAKAKPGEWIQGMGWMNTVWEESGYPSKEDLDAVSPNNPVILTRADGHMVWVNSKALEIAKVTKSTPNPQGGEYLKTDKGELLGCVTDIARDHIRSFIPPSTVEQQRQAILLAQKQLFSLGITSAMDAGISVTDLDNYKALYEAGTLKLRTYPLIRLMDTKNAQAEFIRNNKPGGLLYNNRLNLRAVKISADGSLGARSAAMLEPYSDRADYTGEYRFTDKELYDVVKLAYNQGYQVATHAIGDGADHQTINAYEQVMKENPQNDPRLRIEHFQILTQADITRAIQLGILPSMQFTHATSDLLMAEDRIGSERIKGAYAWRTIIDKGSIIIGGTDAPVELANPWHTFYAGVTRMSRAGDPEGGWYANEKVTREEVLKSYTIWAAYGQFEENIKGSLEVGKLADFVVLDRNIMTCPEKDMKDTQVLQTISGGEVVFTRDNTVPTVMWNGLPIAFIDQPVVEKGVVLAPVATIMTAIGAEIDKNSGSTGTITFNKKIFTLPITVVDGKDYVSVRTLFDGLGYTVTWYGESRTVSTYR